jgi:chitinase
VLLCAVATALGCTTAAEAKRDRRAPTAPSSFVATQFRDAEVVLSWAPSWDNSRSVRYELRVSDGRVLTLSQVDTSATLRVAPIDGATFTFSLVAIDAASNRSAAAMTSVTLVIASIAAPAPQPAPAPVAMAMASSGSAAPSTPQRFTAFEDYCGDVFLAWKASSDDVDSPRELQYDIYVDGTLFHTVVGGTSISLMSQREDLRRYTIVAVDSDGNESAPAHDELVVDGCD